MAKGPLIILSGPSGSGKSTIIAEVLRRSALPLRVSISATTRAPRSNEVNSVHYFFWSKEKFVEEKQKGAFLESAEVHGNCYGTLLSEVERHRENGIGVLLDIDVQGARQVRQRIPETVTVFLKTSSWEAYERRIRRRGTEDEAAIQRRLGSARRELACIAEYQYILINDDDNLEAAVNQLLEIVQLSFPKE
ncbi:MAG: guanylate kinase [Gemmataceae bacterium]